MTKIDLITFVTFGVLIFGAYAGFAWITYSQSQLSPKSIRASFSLLSPIVFVLLIYASFYVFSNYMPNIYHSVFSVVNDQMRQGGRSNVIISGIIFVFTIGFPPIAGMFLLRFIFKITGERIEKYNS